MVAVDADLGPGLERLAQRPDLVARVVHEKCAAGVGDVDTLCAVGLHQQRLPGEVGRRDHVRHHQEAHGIHAELARVFHVLFGNVGLGAVGCDPHRARPGLVGLLQVMDGGDAGNEKRRHLRVPHHPCDRLYPFEIGVQPETVVETRSGQAVAVRNFDRIHPGLVQRLGNRGDLRQRVLVAAWMHPVAQSHVRDVDLPGFVHDLPRSVVRLQAASANLLTASCSAAASAAEVMMSRLPA